MRSNTNQEQIIGRIYQHTLQIKTVANNSSPNFGKPYITGTLDIVTDEEMLNVITIHYTFETEKTKAGGTNSTYASLKKIMDSGKTVVGDGKDLAWKVRCTPAIALNDFYPQGQDDLVSRPRHEGGFVTIINELPPEGMDRNKFTVDTLITQVEVDEADPEQGINEEYAKIHCAIFNFKNDILPFTLTVRNPSGIKYFEGLGATGSEPIYTKVWGKISSQTVSMQTETESAFGEAAVDVTQRTIREWVVTGAQKEPYAFGDGGLMTMEDLRKAVENRNLMLAETKKRSEEYYASHSATAPMPSAAPNPAIPAGGFNF